MSIVVAGSPIEGRHCPTLLHTIACKTGLGIRSSPTNVNFNCFSLPISPFYFSLCVESNSLTTDLEIETIRKVARSILSQHHSSLNPPGRSIEFLAGDIRTLRYFRLDYFLLFSDSVTLEKRYITDSLVMIFFQTITEHRFLSHLCSTRFRCSRGIEPNRNVISCNDDNVVSQA